MPRRGAKTVVAVLGLALFASGCEGLKRELGMSKQAPDEFRVVARAPLSLPPDFTLRPPEPGAVRPQEGSATDQGRRAVFGADAPGAPAPAPVTTAGAEGLSPGERSLLKMAGADEIDPQIRALVNRETEDLNADTDFAQALLFWQKEQPPGVLVDAEAEARRLRQNAAFGKDVTSGETPTIERRRRALFEGLF